MKRITLFLLVVACLHHAKAQQWVEISSVKPKEVSIDLISSSQASSVFSITVAGYNLNKVTTPRGEVFTVSVGNATPLLLAGSPDLPKVTTTLIIPDEAFMEVSVISSKYKEFQLMDVAPSKGNLTRDTNPHDIPYTYGPVYELNEFFPSVLASLREPFIIRERRGQTVEVCPFQYNPVTRTLRVYYQLTLEVKSTGVSSKNVLKSKSINQSSSADFNQVYERQFLNSVTSDRYMPLEEQGNMLVICHGSFIEQVRPLVDWKRTIGIPTEIVDVATIGATEMEIKQYIASYYNDKGLTYLLLVGDHNLVPTITTGDIGGPSDHAYGYIEGDDHYPEIFVGRFSAEDTLQVNTQVRRTIAYERDPDVSTDWFSKGIGIGSSEGSGDDDEYDWEHMRNLRKDLLAFTYTDVMEFYEGSRGGEDLDGNPTQGMLMTGLNEGKSIINYTGHGKENNWGTTGFTNTSINTLGNNNKWPFIISVACMNGNFINRTCFAEAWLRASNLSGPTGAVATLMATIDQTWDPPMEAQDEMNDILTGSYSDNIKRTFGGIAINGIMKMNDSYGVLGYPMADTWLVFGDPSLVVRTAFPSTITAKHDDSMFIGMNQLQVDCDVNDAFACITMNGEILGTAIVSNNIAILSIPTLTITGTLKLAITAFNHLPYIKDLEVLPLEGPYLVVDNTSIDDKSGNSNLQLDFNETAGLTMAIKNLGNEDAGSVTVIIRSKDKYVVVNDSTGFYPSIAAKQTILLGGQFKVTALANVPDDHDIRFEYTATSPAATWNGVFIIKAYTAVLTLGSSTIIDAGGNNNLKADPGETFNINVTILNAGSSSASGVKGIISTDDPYLLVNVDSAIYGKINGGYDLTMPVVVTALPNTPPGHTATMNFQIMADNGISGNGTLSFEIGHIPVLIIDLDGNHNSGPAIKASLENVGISNNYQTSWPISIGAYKSVFLCLGIFPYNSVLTGEQGLALVNFLANGGNIYMEGGDTWEYNYPTALHPMFKISGESDGDDVLKNIQGIEGTFTSGMKFSYGGENKSIDQIAPVDNAFAILASSNSGYSVAVAYDEGSYKSIGSSIEFGGITDNLEAGSNKDSLMLEYVTFLGLTNTSLLANFLASESTICSGHSISFTDYSAGDIINWLWTFDGATPGTSIEQNPVVHYNTPGSYNVTLTISNGSSNFTTVKNEHVIVETCLGIPPVGLLESTSVYPNPGRNVFTIKIPGITMPVNIKVNSLTGTEVFNSYSSDEYYKMNLEGLSPGLYFLTLTSESAKKVMKLVVIE